MKKVLFFVQTYVAKDGSTIYDRNFINIMHETNKFQIMVLQDAVSVKNLKVQEPTENNDNFEVQTICNNLKGNRQCRIKAFLKMIGSYRKIKKTIKQYNPDIIVIDHFHFLRVWPYFCFKWLKRFRRKVTRITIPHHFLNSSFKGVNKIIIKHIENFCIKNSNYIIFPCPPTYQIAQHIKDNKNRKKIPLAVAVEKIDIPEISKNKNQVCFVGNICNGKGVFELIQSINLVKRHIPDIHLKLIGAYDPKSEFYLKLLNFVNKYNLQENVEFMGRVSDEERNKVLAESMCFCFPSFNEGYGLAMVEAMQFSLPVIAWKISAMPYTVKDGINGLLVKPGNIGDYANSIIKLLTDGDFYNLVSKGALEHYNSLPTIEDMNKQILEFINKLVE